ncbi:MAG: hypothetical protein KAT32_00485 [Candidatus Moranbacteria bacterium]|nr:hypothetical protein [Candidatus Moranbacteria bacterium]
MFKKIFFVFLFGSFLVLPFQNVEAAGLVPCGSAEEGPCTVCHLFLGIMGIIEFLRNLMVIVGLLVITLAGVMYVVSAGSGLTTMAKNAIKYALIGIVVVLMAWLMIVFILKALSAKEVGGDSPNVWLKQEGAWSFSCSTESYIGGDGTDNDSNNSSNSNVSGPIDISDGESCGSAINETIRRTTPSDSELCSKGEVVNYRKGTEQYVWSCRVENSDGSITVASCSSKVSGNSSSTKSGYKTAEEEKVEGDVRDRLDNKDIEINKKACEYYGQRNCTDVGGLTENSISEIGKVSDDFKEWAKENNKNDSFILTGGSETSTIHRGSDDPDSESHANGRKIDVTSKNDDLQDFLYGNKSKGIDPYLTNTGKIWDDKNKTKIYKDPYGNIWAKESNHSDVCIDCPDTKKKY